MIITYFHPFFNSISYVTFKLQTNTAQKIFKPTLYSIFINILFINIKHNIGFFIYDRVPFVQFYMHDKFVPIKLRALTDEETSF